MAILDLKYYGASVLTRPAKPIKRIDNELLKLAQDMLDSMYRYHGVGLAAPQVGVSKRFIVVDCGEEYQNEPYFLINPEVISTDGEQIGPEGCLSLPEFLTDVKRPARCSVRAMDLSGKMITVNGDGLLARCLLHEIDHLDGILFTEMVDNQEALDEGLPVMKEHIRQILAGEISPLPPDDEDEEYDEDEVLEAEREAVSI